MDIDQIKQIRAAVLASNQRAQNPPFQQANVRVAQSSAGFDLTFRHLGLIISLAGLIVLMAALMSSDPAKIAIGVISGAGMAIFGSFFLPSIEKGD